MSYYDDRKDIETAAFIHNADYFEIADSLSEISEDDYERYGIPLVDAFRRQDPKAIMCALTRLVLHHNDHEIERRTQIAVEYEAESRLVRGAI